MKQLLALLFTIAIFTACNAQNAKQSPETKLANDAQQEKVAKKKEVKKEAPLVIDVRSAEEYKGGHVEGAINIPHNEIGKKITEHCKDKTRTIYVYCRVGGRAGRALNTLKKLGYTNVKNLGGVEDAKKFLKK